MLTRWSPFDLIDREFSELVRRAFGEFPTFRTFGTLAGPARAWSPPTDVYTKDGELHVRVELPGINPDTDVEIEVAEGRLTIRGDRRRDETISDEGYWMREMVFGHFERTLTLPQGVDASKVRAHYDAGILDVIVPLPESAGSKVKVEVGPPAQRRELQQ